MPIFNYIISLILLENEIKINIYDNISNIINKIKEQNAIAKDIYTYILQV